MFTSKPYEHSSVHSIYRIVRPSHSRYHQYLATMKQNNMVPSLKQMPCAAPISAVSSSLPPSPLRPAVPGRRAKRPRSYRARTLSSTGPTTRPPSPLYSVPADEPRETQHKTTAVKAKGKCSSKRDPTVSATSDDPQLTNYSLPAASDYSTFVERLRAKSAGRRGGYCVCVYVYVYCVC